MAEEPFFAGNDMRVIGGTARCQQCQNPVRGGAAVTSKPRPVLTRFVGVCLSGRKEETAIEAGLVWVEVLTAVKIDAGMRKQRI